jgi:hypothetical protein
MPSAKPSYSGRHATPDHNGCHAEGWETLWALIAPIAVSIRRVLAKPKT